MKLKDLGVGQNFQFVEGNGKTWRKLSNNGGVCEYNYCRCIDDMRPDERRGLRLSSGCNDKPINKEAEVILVIR